MLFLRKLTLFACHAFCHKASINLLKSQTRGRMSVERNELQEALLCYIKDTLTYINTVRTFCEVSAKWMSGRESELKKLNSIKKRAGGIDMNITDVTQSEEKGAAPVDYTKIEVPQVTTESRLELEKELTAVLMDTVGELKKLKDFLDAVEKLAVTSLHVFVKEDQVVLNLPEGVGLHHVQVVIIAARLVCPLLLKFKRDPNVFFLPKLQNVEVLAYQLDIYIKTTQLICGMFEKSPFSDFSLKVFKETAASSSVDLSDDNKHVLLELTKQLDDISAIGDFSLKMIKKTAVSLSVDLSEENIQRMLSHTNQLDGIRMNQDFRLVSLFGDSPYSVFLNRFSDCQPRMMQCLTKLEEVAVQLDSMNKGARISSVVGSSVGAIGSVLSIVGLALSPVTAGVSFGLTMTGVGLSVTSVVNGVVTTATEMGVNSTQQKKADVVFKQFIEDVQSLQDCLGKVSAKSVAAVDASPAALAVGVSKVLSKAGFTVGGINSLINSDSAVKLLKAKDLVADAVKVVAPGGIALRNVPQVTADIPNIGQTALKGPLALSKTARAGLIGLNAFFLGMDIFFICKDSISLSKGSETVVSQFIRARSTLWGSEIDAWKKIHDSLSKGQSTVEENRIILETPFYPEEVVDNIEKAGQRCVIQ